MFVGIQVYTYTVIQVYCDTGIQAYRCSGVQVYKYKYTGRRAYRYIRIVLQALAHRYVSIQESRYIGVCMYTYIFLHRKNSRPTKMNIFDYCSFLYFQLYFFPDVSKEMDFYREDFIDLIDRI